MSSSRCLVVMFSGHRISAVEEHSIANVVAQYAHCNIEDIAIHQLDPEDVAKALVKSVQPEVVHEENHDVTIHIAEGRNCAKLQAVKVIKEILGFGLKQSKDAFDSGKIVVSYDKCADLIKNLMDCGVMIQYSGLDDEFAKKQAEILINSYSGDIAAFSRDVAAAKIHREQGTASTYELALLNAVEIMNGTIK